MLTGRRTRVCRFQSAAESSGHVTRLGARKQTGHANDFAWPVIFCAEFSALSLVRQFEVDRDLRLNLDRLAVEQVGLVFPLLDGIGRSFRQQRLST